jgi:hypothetical protein
MSSKKMQSIISPIDLNNEIYKKNYPQFDKYTSDEAHQEPDFIDLDNVDLKDSGLLVPKTPLNITTAKEYEDDLIPLLVKTNILEFIDVISKIEDSEDKSVIYQTMCLLRNTIILHRKVLEVNLHIVEIADKALLNLDLNYDRFILHNMLNNIKKGNSFNNIHFRNINETISDMPPIPAEERIHIEKNLQYYRFTKQIKKKLKPFKSGDIVGAKDKENNWWLSRVLYVYTTDDCPDYWYYIRFEGWGSKHDEWISSNRYRVQQYRPKKHFLKRS